MVNASNAIPKVFIFDIFGVLCGLEDGKVNSRMFEVVEKLRHKYNVSILSNADYASVMERFERQSFPLEKYFDYIFISSETGFLKPGLESFRHCLSEMEIVANEAVFIDDTNENVITAESIGIKSYRFNNVDEFEGWLGEMKF